MVTIHRTPSRNDRAIELLKRAAAEQDEISRINLIGDFVPHGRVNEPERRQWLEAWQVLERVGFVCPTLGNPKDGDWWFVTSAGRAALNGDIEGELALRLPRG